jgi:hypothetical protein
LLFWWWGLHLLIRWRQLRCPWGDHKSNRHLQIVCFNTVATAQGGMGASDANGVQLRAVPFDATADRFSDEVFDLFAADLHIR